MIQVRGADEKAPLRIGEKPSVVITHNDVQWQFNVMVVRAIAGSLILLNPQLAGLAVTDGGYQSHDP